MILKGKVQKGTHRDTQQIVLEVNLYEATCLGMVVDEWPVVPQKDILVEIEVRRVDR